MINFSGKEKYCVEDLRRLISLLRSGEGCPWDRAQTHESIRRNLLEEAYEAAEAIDQNNPEYLKEELGDVLMQVVFHADIEAAAGRFDLDDVADAVCRKLIFRHPHVFSPQKKAEDWETIKRKEKHVSSTEEELKRVARSLPALWRCEKVLQKAAASGVTVLDTEASQRLLAEKSQALVQSRGLREQDEEWLGQVLMAAVMTACCLQLDPERLVHDAVDRFIAAFAAAEKEEEPVPAEELLETRRI